MKVKVASHSLEVKFKAELLLQSEFSSDNQQETAEHTERGQ